ncbi:hypothetical protein VM1G_01186 [Cytospora mali]|uniref:Nephrocystin 3-like N-terminal domain-containing protein n=1 Tax=Cytospora mali TaxID=578113 RepID=A0A194VND9_CYTMA|nr:hypothetical protein VM1G_01186 [Valsa mali]
MEVLAAISLAGNVAQFLGYGISTVRLASQIMRSVTGTSKHLTELEIISTDITATLEAIQKERQSSSGLERDEVLHELVEQCLDLSREIINLINGLKVKKNARPRIMEGTYKVGLTVYKKKELEHLSGRLFDLRTQVTSHLIVLIEQQQRDIHETLRRFSDSNEKYQDLFDKHLHVVMGYLDKISNKLDPHEVADGKTADFTTVQSSNGFLESVGIDDGDEEAEDAQEALSSYIDIVDHLYRVELGAHAESKRQSILESLRFSQLHERELLIPKAHQQTFEWIFDSTEEFSFNDWLRSRNGIFWVAGKAGSGKSSLMRFITEHPTTFKLLSQWADGNITVAKHYFWNPGTALQKSQEGLLRTCLLQILSTRPHLIPAICADRWAAPYAARYSPWTRSQLLKALKSLKDTADESSNPHLKLCLLIDGLDEYEGDHVELINILSDLAECSNIKICVSSRPWLDFSDAFDGSPWKIYLQDLTRQDISRYVQDKLEEDERFKRLQSKNNTAASDLINDVTIRSEGVFLWVFLVVRSLLRGLRNQDDLAILRQRLEALPVDLSAFFDRILDSIEDVYRQRTARLFLALSSARRSFPVLSFFFLDLDDPKYPADPPDLAFLKEWPDGDTRSFEALITKKRQLVAQCKDIIHIASDPKAPVLFGERVTFLHRTVVDFMNKDDTSLASQ